MGRLEKLVEKFLRRPPEVRFQEVVYVLQHFGWSPARTQGKHPTFVKPGYPTITLPLKKGRHKVKGVYIQKIVNLLNLEEWYEQRKRA